jgi:leucyl aminopeptidase (aminopeptidase T)
MFMELYEACLKTARDLARINAGEQVLILADTAIDWEMIKLLSSAARILGAQSSIMIYETRDDVNIEPPKPVAEAMKSSDVVISLPLMYILHTTAYNDALKAGARILELTGTTPDMMIRLIGRTNYPVMCKLGDRLTELTKKAREVLIKSENGTNIKFENDANRPVFHNDGILNEKGIYKPLGGQISWAPIEDSIEGVIVADTFIWPPSEIGVLRSPVRITMRGGRITKIEGGVEARVFESWLRSLNDEKMYYLAHASWGFHPKAKLSGIPLEDERIYAGVEFGFGSQSLKFRGKIGKAKSHTDLGIFNPEVYFDGVPITHAGRFVHEDLLEYDRKIKG